MPLADLPEAVQRHQHIAPTIQTYNHYYTGNHQLAFATTSFIQQYGRLFQSLRENLCPAVVSAVTDRLRIESWGTTTANNLANEAGLTRLQAAIHQETAKTGNAFTLTWPGKDNKPVARFHSADQIIPTVNPYQPDQLHHATKLWIQSNPTSTQTRHGRANIYYATHVERWRTKHPLTGHTIPHDPAAWTPHTDTEGAHIIPHPFTAVPVCWYKRGTNSPEEYGTSLLADVIPLQDALNKSLADLLVLSETHARPFWYLLQYKPAETNPLTALKPTTGMQKFDGSKQRIFTHDGPGPFGQLTPPNLTPLLEQQAAIREKIAAVVGIPAYYFTQSTGMIPSGESLRVLSSRLTATIRAFQDVLTPVWKGQAQLLGLDTKTIKWQDPIPMDESERITNALRLQSLGLALPDIVNYLGLPDAEAVIQRAQHAQTENATHVGKALAAGRIPATY